MNPKSDESYPIHILANLKNLMIVWELHSYIIPLIEALQMPALQ